MLQDITIPKLQLQIPELLEFADSDLFGNYALMALSFKQPFAAMMLHGKIETRVWWTDYRGLVLICASKSPYTSQSLNKISGQVNIDRIENTLANDPTRLIFGSAVAIANLVACRRMKPEDESKCYVKYHPDLWCHIYQNVIPIIPFTYKGKRKWGKVNGEEITQISKMVYA